MTSRRYRNLEPAGFLFICLILLALTGKRFESSSFTAKVVEAYQEGIYIQLRGEVPFKETRFFDHPPPPEELFPGFSKINFSGNINALSETEPIVSSSRLEIIKNDRGWSVSRKEIPAWEKLTLGIPLSLNRETEEGLTALPGIGPRTAEILVMERRKRGGFKSMDEIKSIKGIGNGIFQKVRLFLTL